MQLEQTGSRTSADPFALPVVTAFAVDWYRKLDQHVPVDELLPMLSDAELEFHLPEGIVRGQDGFRRWYDGVVTIFFDEVHEVRSVAVAPSDGGAVVDVVVNWQFRRWRPPSARSHWGGFDAFQRWDMVPGIPANRPVIRRYVVNELRPMPGSPAL